MARALDRVTTEYVAIHDAARPLVTPQLIVGNMEVGLGDVATVTN